MRLFAWCAITQSTSSIFQPTFASVSRATCSIDCTATLKTCGPFMLHEDLALREHVGRGGPARAAARDLDQVAVLTVGLERRREHAAGLVAALEHDRARRVAEQDADRALLVVHEARQPFAAREQHALIARRLQHARRDLEPVHEAGAGRVHVERRNREALAQIAVHVVRGRRRERVGRAGRDDDQVEIFAA